MERIGRNISARGVVKATGAASAVAGGAAVAFKMAEFIVGQGPAVITLSLAFITVLGIVLYKATGE